MIQGDPGLRQTLAQLSPRHPITGHRGIVEHRSHRSHLPGGSIDSRDVLWNGGDHGLRPVCGPVQARRSAGGIDNEQDLAVIGGGRLGRGRLLAPADVAPGEDPKHVVPRAVTGGDDGSGPVDPRDDLNQRLFLRPQTGGVEEIADVNVAAVPYPVLVGEVPIGDDAPALQVGQRGSGAPAGQCQQLLRRSDGSRGGHEVQQGDGLGHPCLRWREAMGVAQPRRDLSPATRLASRRDAERTAGNEVVVHRVEAQRRQRTSGRKARRPEERLDAVGVRACQEREQRALVLAVAAAQLGQHQRSQRMQRIAGGHYGRVGEFRDAERPHLLGVGPSPAADAGLQALVADAEHGADQGAGLSGRVHERHVLETALHLGPLAALHAVCACQAVLEREVLKRDHEDGQPRSLPGLGELLQQVGIRVAAVTDRFEVLAELVDDQQQRRVLRQAASRVYEDRRRRARAARIGLSVSAPWRACQPRSVERLILRGGGRCREELRSSGPAAQWRPAARAPR